MFRWGPLLGPSHAFDPTRFFIFCANVLGSPYGTASPVSKNLLRDDGGRWGPEFPATVVRDDVRYTIFRDPSSTPNLKTNLRFPQAA